MKNNHFPTTLDFLVNRPLRGLLLASLILGLTLPLFSQEPRLQITRDGVLTWPSNANSYVVMETSTLDQTWEPMLAPITSAEGSNMVAINLTEPSQFFQLKSGIQYQDSFIGPGNPWSVMFFNPQDSERFIFTYNNGLRIQGQSGAGMVILIPPTVNNLSDLKMSLDILAWDATATGESIGLYARANGSQAYIGRVKFGDQNYGGRASMGIFLGSALTIVPFDAKSNIDYRLVFSLVGNELTLVLFDVSNLENPLLTLNTTNNVLPPFGGLGIFANANQSTFDVMVNNFFVTGVY